MTVWGDQALFCQVTPKHVLNMCDVSNIWHVPIMLEAQDAHKSICDILGLGGYNKMNLTGNFPTHLSHRVLSNFVDEVVMLGSQQFIYRCIVTSSCMVVAAWRTSLAEKWDGLSAVVSIAMVGKYTGLSDAYLSVLKALQHACLAASRKLDVQWVEASHLEDSAKVCPLLERPCHAQIPSRHFCQQRLVVFY
jgi:CTP synthase